jgi:predicted nucleic acid-binding protein
VSPPAIVLDAAALDDITRNQPLRALLRATAERGGSVCCSAVTIAEAARGLRRVAEVHHALAVRIGASSIQVKPVDESMGFLVGALLNSAAKGSEALADACVVATCAPFSHVVVVTSDPDDIHDLAQHLPGVRVRTTRPDLQGFKISAG